MKVLITTPCLKDVGGVASYYNSILPYLKKFGDINISTFEMGSTTSKKMLFHPLADQWRFIRKISLEKFDFIHINPSLNFKSFIRDGLFSFWAKRKNLPVMIFFHGWDESFYNKISENLNFFFKKTYQRADQFIVLASDFRSMLINKGIDQPIHVLTTCVDDSLLESFSIESKIKRLKTSKLVKVLFLSRIEKKKGVFETLDACKLLIDQGYNITLAIAGEGSAKQAVEAYIDDNDLHDKVYMAGYVTGQKKIEMFAENDVYCLPSYSEGMPNSVLEAMAFGMPVITRPVGGLKDFFKNGEMGYLAESTQPEEIAKLLTTIIGDNDRLCNIAEYNYKYATKNFLASKAAKDLCMIYSQFCYKNSL